MILGIGIDLVDIARVHQLLARQGERAVARLFTPGEASYARQRAEPARHFASRFAAKEAAFKALAGNDLARCIGWLDIEVVVHGDGRPALALRGAAERRAAEMGVRHAFVSLTHSDATAGAVVVLEGGGADAGTSSGTTGGS
jgi:holo-[acyl-carrier protein] synthase